MSIGEAVKDRMLDLAEFYNRMDALPSEEITDYTSLNVVATFCDKLGISLLTFFEGVLVGYDKDAEDL